MEILKVALFLFLSLLSSVVYGEMSENEKLGLLNECSSVRAIVEPLNEDVDANEIGLTTEVLPNFRTGC